MEISHIRGFAELGMEDDSGFYVPWPMDSFDDEEEELSKLSISAAFGENLHDSFSNPIYDLKPSLETSHTGMDDRPMKQLKTNNWSTYTIDHISNRPPAALPFVNSNYTGQVGIVKPKEEVVCSKTKSATTLPSDVLVTRGTIGNQSYVFKASQGAKTKSPSTKTRLAQAHDHIIAERKRREKLSQRFIALSALLPGLKKTDKASVLGDAIKYLKQLQERMKTLEEQTRKKSTESMVFVKKYELFTDAENCSSDENSSGCPIDEPLLEIEAKFSDKDVLIRIHCEKRKGALEKTVAVIEKLHLSIINSTAMIFGSSALDITIIAQMDTEFTMTMKDFVKNLHSALKQFM